MRLLAALLLVTALVGCGRGDGPGALNSPTTAPTQVISGAVTLNQESHMPVGQPCTGYSGYDDIRPGAQVTVKDQTGTIVAVGQLDAGVSLRAETRVLSGIAGTRCRFPFTVGGIPDRPFYEVTVANRAPIRYAKADLEAQSWSLDLSLG